MKKYCVRMVVLSVLVGVLLWMAADGDRGFSEQENRNLAQFPEMTAESIFSGAFMSEFEIYLADQFPARDACIRLKTAIRRAAGQKLIDGYYLAKDDYLIPEESVCDWRRVEELIGLINEFSGRFDGINVSFMLAPTAVSIYADKLPYTADVSQTETMALIEAGLDSTVSYIDLYPVLYADRETELYYRTDHHWTTRAAYGAFVQYAKSLGIAVADDGYVFYPVTDEFQGTCASGSGIYETLDVIEICVPVDSEGSYVVNYVEEMKKTATLFDGSRLELKDKYQVFMGGNHAQVEIKTNAGTGRNLLLIKDSYGNCMVPMLTPHFDKIVVVDPRYFCGDIGEVMQINRINEVLFLYNVNSFVTDNSLDIMLEEVSR